MGALVSKARVQLDERLHLQTKRWSYSRTSLRPRVSAGGCSAGPSIGRRRQAAVGPSSAEGGPRLSRLVVDVPVKANENPGMVRVLCPFPTLSDSNKVDSRRGMQTYLENGAGPKHAGDLGSSAFREGGHVHEPGCRAQRRAWAFGSTTNSAGASGWLSPPVSGPAPGQSLGDGTETEPHCCRNTSGACIGKPTYFSRKSVMRQILCFFTAWISNLAHGW